jgi:hypothetical protein
MRTCTTRGPRNVLTHKARNELGIFFRQLFKVVKQLSEPRLRMFDLLNALDILADIAEAPELDSVSPELTRKEHDCACNQRSSSRHDDSAYAGRPQSAE